MVLKIRNQESINIFHSNLKLPDPESLSGESVAQNSFLGLTLSRRTSTVTHSSGHAFHVQCNLDLPIIHNNILARQPFTLMAVTKRPMGQAWTALICIGSSLGPSNPPKLSSISPVFLSGRAGVKS